MLHKHTHDLITLINEFYSSYELSNKMYVTHCVFGSNKKKEEGTYLELISFKQNEDYRIWHYCFHFAVIKERHAASQELFYALFEVLKGFTDKVKMNLAKMCVDIFIIERVSSVVGDVPQEIGV